MKLSEKDILKEIRKIIKFPAAKICKHYVAASLLSMLEEFGYPLTQELAASVVDADDDKSISLLNDACGD